MVLLKNYYHYASVLVFIVSIVLAHIMSTDSYDWMSNTISDLGAQAYVRRYIMQFGFIAFGLVLSGGILLNGLSLRTAPILVYAVSVALTGIFCTKPFVGETSYSVTEASLHSFFAQIAGIAFTVGVLVQLFYTPNMTDKWIHFTFFLMIIGLSALFGILSEHQGVAQRFLYLVSFTWLVRFYKP